MRIAIALLAIVFAGCASKGTKEAQPARQTAAIMTQHFTLQPSDITTFAVRTDVAETRCWPTSKTVDGAKFYDCTLFTVVALIVDAKDTKGPQEFQGMDEFNAKGFKTKENIAVPDTDAARAELAAIHQDALKGLERRYRLLTNGCNGQQIELTLVNQQLRLEAGEYLTDLRCNMRKRTKKNVDSVVFFYDSMTRGVQYAKAQGESAAKAVVSFMETSADNVSFWKRKIQIQVADKGEKIGKKIAETAESARPN